MTKQIFRIKWAFYSLAVSLICYTPTEAAEDCQWEEAPYTLIPKTGCLADKFQTGRFTYSDVLLYLKYAAEVFMIIVASASLIFVIIGGYQYLMSLIAEDKEGGKNTITYALIGLVVSILSWIIINSVLYVVTSVN